VIEIPSTVRKKKCTTHVNKGIIDFLSELRLSVKTKGEGLRGLATRKKVIGRSQGLVSKLSCLGERGVGDNDESNRREVRGGE